MAIKKDPKNQISAAPSPITTDVAAGNHHRTAGTKPSAAISSGGSASAKNVRDDDPLALSFKNWFILEEQILSRLEDQEAMDDVLLRLWDADEILNKGELTPEDLARADTRKSDVSGAAAILITNARGEKVYLVGDKLSSYMLNHTNRIGEMTNVGSAQRNLFSSQFQSTGINIDLSGPTLLNPRLADKIKRDPQIAGYVEMTFQAAKRNGLDPVMLANQFWQESKFNPRAVSHAGAMGIAQMMPFHKGNFGLKSLEDFADGQKSIDAGAQMMGQLSRKYGDQRLAVVAYNGGGKAIESAAREVGKQHVTYEEWDAVMSERRARQGSASRGAWHNETRDYARTILGVAPQPS